MFFLQFLHLHMLIWIKGAWNPQEVRDRLISDDSEFKREIIEYLESCQIGEFQTGTMEDMQEKYGPGGSAHNDDPTQRLPMAPPPSECESRTDDFF